MSSAYDAARGGKLQLTGLVIEKKESSAKKKHKKKALEAAAATAAGEARAPRKSAHAPALEACARVRLQPCAPLGCPRRRAQSMHFIAHRARV